MVPEPVGHSLDDFDLVIDAFEDAGVQRPIAVIQDALDVAIGLKRKFYTFGEADIVICPAFTALGKVYDEISDSSIMLGAQDMYWEEEGAFTERFLPRC